MSKQTTILLSAAGGMPSLGVIDVLQSEDVEVVGIDSDPYSFGLHYLESGYTVPRGDDPSFVDSLLNIVRKKKVDALLLSPESEVIAVSRQKDRFVEAGCLPLCPEYETVERCVDKVETAQAFESLDIPTPTLYHDAQDTEYPCIVKPRYGRGSSGVNVAENPEELSVYVDQLEEPLIQEYIEGEEYTVDVLTDEGGEVLSAVPRQRIAVDSGKSVTGMTVTDEEIREYSREIASSWKLYGPSCIQCIRSSEGIHFIEVNNRFGGGAVLSMHADGELLPNLLSMVDGIPTMPTSEYKTNLVMLRNYEQMFLDNSEIEKYE